MKPRKTTELFTAERRLRNCWKASAMALNKKDEQENQRNQPRRGDGKRQSVHRLWETKEKDRQLGRAERSCK